VNAELPRDMTHEEYMKMSLCMLSLYDAIYLLEGWEESRGANREYGYAVAAQHPSIMWLRAGRERKRPGRDT